MSTLEPPQGVLSGVIPCPKAKEINEERFSAKKEWGRLYLERQRKKLND
jgi:hypothetical protein